MAKILAVLFALTVLCLVPLLGTEAEAQILPPEMAQRIGAAAEQGRQHKAAMSDVIDERRQAANRQLETVVIAAINQRPDLFQPIMLEAHRQAPESRASLNKTVAGMFPGFAGTLRSPTVAPPPRTQSEQEALAAKRTRPGHDPRAQAIAGVAPPDQRPEDWPILPKEGGVDGYADKDPLEGLNKVFFYTNGALDFLVFEPLANGYRYITPEGARKAISRAFDNLTSPITFANDLLQFRFQRAATTFTRFVINSTVGVLGLFDVAAELGLEGHSSDFGQTLYTYGVGDGIYLVLPFFGPTTARDAVGIGIDSLLDPRSWFIGSTERLALLAGEGIVRREELIDPIDFLVEHADNSYNAVRAWTFQQREFELTGECPRRTRTVCSAR